MPLAPDNDDTKWDNMRKLLAESTCHYCKYTGAIRLEIREDYVQDGPIIEPDPRDTLQQRKVNLKTRTWPWAICDHCGHESKGSLA